MPPWFRAVYAMVGGGLGMSAGATAMLWVPPNDGWGRVIACIGAGILVAVLFGWLSDSFFPEDED